MDLNADICTEYSSKFTTDRQGFEDGDEDRSVPQSELELAREEAVLEMKARGESVDVDDWLRGTGKLITYTMKIGA